MAEHDEASQAGSAVEEGVLEDSTEVLQVTDAERVQHAAPGCLAYPCNEEADIAKILERLENKEFPLVKVTEQQCMSVAAAADILAWIQKEDYVKLQSFIDQKWHEYRTNAQKDPSTPEAVLRARWSRLTYYVHLQEFDGRRRRAHAAMDALCVYMGGTKLSSEESLRLCQCLTSPSDISVAQVTAYVESQWPEVLKTIPSYARSTEKEMKEMWVHEQCTLHVESFVTKLRSSLFVPDVLPQDLPTAEEQQKAKDISVLVRAEQVPQIKAAVEAAYAEEHAKVPTFVGMRADFRRSFMLARYWDIVGAVIQDAGDSASGFVFQPALRVATLTSESDRAAAEAIIKEVQSHHVQAIEALVASEYKEARRVFGQGISAEVEGTLWTAWALEHYFKLVAQVVGQSEQSSSKKAMKRSVTAEIAVGDAMFTSPERKKRGPRTPNLDCRSEASLSVAQLHEAEGKEATHKISLQACVLYFPKEPRWVSVKIRGSSETERVPVLSVLLADRTGPILLESWRLQSEVLLASLLDWEETKEEGAVLKMEFVDFDVRADTRVHLTPMTRLHSNERTVFRKLLVADQDNMHVTTRVYPGLYKRDFLTLAVKLPFATSIAGVVSSVDPEKTSQNGNQMQAFRLQDAQGRYVRCMALGRHAGNPALVLGNMIVLYFVVGQEGLSNGPGQLWVYDESHVMVLETGHAVVANRTEVSLRQ